MGAAAALDTNTQVVSDATRLEVAPLALTTTTIRSHKVVLLGLYLLPVNLHPKPKQSATKGPYLFR